ncbi:TIL domain-containing protein [Caerostris darwini]|uniref:TIL domain-containing protein n=1 Tax=Caerostris darwini TaxID=1538125 RepID=A0AAV4PUG8_9ARAC|nr:TIL domain-containing protein [Caerostris darwini]
MKFVISVCIITLLCFAFCCSQLDDPDCHGNTTKGTYTPCQKRCDNLGHPPSVCPLFIIHGCTCKDGYIPVDRNYNPLKCVKEEDCPE